jgi:hydrogenase-4 component B
MNLYLAAFLCALLSGFPGLFVPRRGARTSALLMGLSSVFALAAAGWVLLVPAQRILQLPAPWGSLNLDATGAFFLIPVALLFGSASLYGVSYWDDHHEGAWRLRILFGLLGAALIWLVAAAHPYSFLLGWEIMALAAFLLVMTEDRDPETRKAAWIYLVATHTSTLALFGAFALLSKTWNGGDFSVLPKGLAATGTGTVIFCLSLASFGMKAGIFPLHFWLPTAHAAAPSHVSAVMSGVLIKMGILGLVRLISWTPDPPIAWGTALVVLGALSGILGVLLALGQHDLKRLLAYHSVENIGIILLGLGLGTLGKASGNPALQVLGFGAALFHVLNHALFKGLLFLAAGAVVKVSGTRNIERLGGLARLMPRTAAAFLLGSWAICGLPPLNGFASEWVLYLGAFRGLGLPHWGSALVILAALALIGALALACFAKAFGAVFLGEPRTQKAAAATEVDAAMTGAMGILAGGCILLGLAPLIMALPLDRVLIEVCPGGPALPRLSELIPLLPLSIIALVIAVLAFFLWRWVGRTPSEEDRLPTWDCGYAQPTPRMQYTASSFADMVFSWFSWLLLPIVRTARIKGFFPFASSFHSQLPDLVLDRGLEPGLKGTARLLGALRFLQAGHLSVYLLYVLLTLLTLLVWMVA